MTKSKSIKSIPLESARLFFLTASFLLLLPVHYIHQTVQFIWIELDFFHHCTQIWIIFCHNRSFMAIHGTFSVNWNDLGAEGVRADLHLRGGCICLRHRSGEWTHHTHLLEAPYVVQFVRESGHFASKLLRLFLTPQELLSVVFAIIALLSVYTHIVHFSFYVFVQARTSFLLLHA